MWLRVVWVLCHEYLGILELSLKWVFVFVTGWGLPEVLGQGWGCFQSSGSGLRVRSHDDHVMLLIPLYLTGVFSLFSFPHPLSPFHHWFLNHPTTSQSQNDYPLCSVCWWHNGRPSHPQSTPPIGRFLSYDLFGELYWWNLVRTLLVIQLNVTLSGPLYPKLSTCLEGTQLTQLVQLVTASRLFLGHKGRVDLYIDECLYHCVCFGHKGFLLQVSVTNTIAYLKDITHLPRNSWHKEPEKTSNQYINSELY